MKLKYIMCWIFAVLVLSKRTATEAQNSPSNCSLWTDQNIALWIQKTFDKDKLVIYANVSIAGETGAFFEPRVHSILDPTKWIFTKDDTARSIINFNEQFRIMSLNILSLSVHEIDIQLKQQPENCFVNSSVDAFEHALRVFLLGLVDHEKQSYEFVNICNTHIVESSNDKVEILDICCRSGLNTDIVCKTNNPGKWFITLKTFTFVLMMIAFGFIVYARPTFLHETYTNVSIELRGTLFIEKTSGKEQDDPVDIEMKGDNEDRSNCMTVRIQKRKVSDPDTITNGIFKFIWGFLFLSDITDYSESTKNCLYEKCLYGSGCTWRYILKIIKNIIVAMLMILPIVIRFLFLFKYTKPYSDKIDEEIASRNLTLHLTLDSYFESFLGGIIELIVSFLFFIYLLFIVGVLSFVRKCVCADLCRTPLNIKSEAYSHDTLNTFIDILLQRHAICKCSPFRLHNVLLLPLSLCCAIIYLICMIFPTGYVFCNMLQQLQMCFTSKSDKQEKELLVEKPDTSYQWYVYIIAISLFILFGSLFFLLGGGIYFYIQCIVYIITGVVLNYNAVIDYVGPVMFILLYGRNRIQAVNKLLDNYEILINKSMRAVFNNNNPRVVKIDNNCPENAENIDDENMYMMSISENNRHSIVNEHGNLKLHVEGGVIFVKKCHLMTRTFISRNLLHYLASLPHPSCPGSPLKLYLQAVSQVLGRAIILAFILNIILALGNDLSSAMKTLFAFLTGCIVTWIKKFSINSESASVEDKEYWRDVFKCKTEVLNRYTERLPVKNIKTSESSFEENIGYIVYCEDNPKTKTSQDYSQNDIEICPLF